MEICIFDGKIRNDDLTAKYLGSAVANVFLLPWNSRESKYILILSFHFTKNISSYSNITTTKNLNNIDIPFFRFWLIQYQKQKQLM